MKEALDEKRFFFVDESGDPTILARGGRDLLSEGLVSKIFMVGYVEIADPKGLNRKLIELRNELAADEYLKGIPSMSSSIVAFHANKDCSEVREKVFRILREAQYQAFAVVARKDEHLFRKKFDLKPAKLYEYLVSKLFENRLHLYSSIDIYFASMGNTVREANMRMAIESAREAFKEKWGKENSNSVRIFVQEASQLPLLQVVDYTLWAINRVFERGDFRYYNFLKERISLVQDIFDAANYPKTYYTPRNPLSPENLSPAGS